jgi:peptide deformylase
MKIITAPHYNLRQTSQPVKHVDDELIKFVADFKNTLATKKNPSGVGLAAPQVNKLWQIFAINFAATEFDPPQIEIFINPSIGKTSQKVTFGQDKKNPTFEGCLSIPFIYGPIPRFEWVDLEYDEIKKDKLVRTKRKLEWFHARVAQHEHDHLYGVLFTDYSLKFDLPLYQENKKNDTLEEIDKKLVELF